MAPTRASLAARSFKGRCTCGGSITVSDNTPLLLGHGPDFTSNNVCVMYELRDAGKCWSFGAVTATLCLAVRDVLNTLHVRYWT